MVRCPRVSVGSHRLTWLGSEPNAVQKPANRWRSREWRRYQGTMMPPAERTSGAQCAGPAAAPRWVCVRVQSRQHARHLSFRLWFPARRIGRARAGTVCHRHLQGGSRWPPGCVLGWRVARHAWVQQGGRRDSQAVCIADEQVRCPGAGFAELDATHAGRGQRIQPVARQLNQKSFKHSRQGNWLGDSRAGHGLGRDAARLAEGRVSVPLSAPDLGTTVQMPCQSRRPHLVPHLRDQPGTGLLILGRPASPHPTNLLAGGT